MKTGGLSAARQSLFRASKNERSGDRSPSAIRIAAGGAARDLRPAVDVNGVREGAAGRAGLLIGWARHDIAIAAGIRVAPGDGCARRASLEGLHLRGIGALLVLVVQGRSDAVADQAAKQRATNGASNP